MNLDEITTIYHFYYYY